MIIGIYQRRLASKITRFPARFEKEQCYQYNVSKTKNHCFENATDVPYTQVFQPHNDMGVILWESHYNTLILPLCNCVMARKYKSILQAQMLNAVPQGFSCKHT